MLTILGMLLVGLVAGALARLLLPGRDPLGCLGTALVGIAGSYAGGAVAGLLLRGEVDLRRTDSFLGSVVGAMLVLVILRLLRGAR